MPLTRATFRDSRLAFALMIALLPGCAELATTTSGLATSLETEFDNLANADLGLGLDAQPSAAIPAEGRLIDALSLRYEPPDESLRIGRDQDLAERRAEGFGLVHGPSLKGHLDSVLARLVEASGVEGVAPEAYVRASMDVGAFATPDEMIYVDIGLLRNLTHDGELAYLMAHELSHVLLRHHNADTMVQAQRDIFEAAVLVERSRAMIEHRGDVSGWEDSNVVEHMETGLEISEDYVIPLWSRDQETEADLLAVDLLVRANYGVEGALAFFDRVIELDRMIAAANPEPADVALANADWTSSRSRTDVGNTLLEGLRGAAVGAVKARHKSWDVRKRDVQSYVTREYVDTVPPRKRPREWKQLQRRRDVTQLLENYWNALEAGITLRREALTPADLARAAELSERSIQGVTARHALPLLVRSDVQLRSRQIRPAIDTLSAALESPEPAVEVYEHLAGLYMLAGDFDPVVGLADQAATAFGESPRLFPLRVFAHRLSGRIGDLFALQQDCAAVPSMREKCDEHDSVAAQIVGAREQAREAAEQARQSN